jgi:hypothetical protein
MLFAGKCGTACNLKSEDIAMATNLAELLADVERQTAKAAPRPTAAVATAAPLQPALAPLDDDTGVAMVTVRFDTQILARVDAAAKRVGINRVAWLHLAAEKLLGDRGDVDSTPTEDTKRVVDLDQQRRPPAPSVLRDRDQIDREKA